MTPASRGKTWWGLGLALVLVILGGLYFSGLAPLPFGQPKPKPLCYVSPKNPNFIKEAPGKDPEGNELVPVFATPAAGPPPAAGPAVAPVAQKEPKTRYWRCPMHPEIVREAPSKCPKCGMDLVPVRVEEAPAPAAKKERKIKYWVSPMDPGYVRDKPGKAPCGMDMVPVYEDTGEGAGTPGAIAVSPTTIQSMGVRTAKVEVRPLSRLTLTVGLVTFNERNLSTITTKVNGWLERLYVNATGDPVRKGQALISIYSPELVSSQEE